MSRRLAFGLAAAAALLALAAMTAIFGTVFWRIVTNAHDATGDYIVFYAAGWLVRDGQTAGLYDPPTIEAAERLLYPGTFDEALGFVLPVFVAWLFAPLSMLPFTASFLLWIGLNVVLLLALLFTVDRALLGGVPDGTRRAFLVLSALSMPVVTTLVFGQVDLIVLAGLLGGYLALRAERPYLAGLALCLVLIKPHFLAGAGLLLLARRDWRPIATLAGVGVPLLTLPALLTAPEALLSNVEILTAYPGSNDELSVNAPVMANWRGFVTSVTNSNEPLLWLPGLVAITLAALAAAWPRWRGAVMPSGPEFDRAYSLAVVLPLLVSPHLHTQSLSLLLLPAVLALRALLGQQPSEERQQAAFAAMLAVFATLFFLPFFAIQGLSLTFFLIAGAFMAVAYRWPGGEVKKAAVLDDRGPGRAVPARAA